MQLVNQHKVLVHRDSHVACCIPRRSPAGKQLWLRATYASIPSMTITDWSPCTYVAVVPAIGSRCATTYRLKRVRFWIPIDSSASNKLRASDRLAPSSSNCYWAIIFLSVCARRKASCVCRNHTAPCASKASMRADDPLHQWRRGAAVSRGRTVFFDAALDEATSETPTWCRWPTATGVLLSIAAARCRGSIAEHCRHNVHSTLRMLYRSSASITTGFIRIKDRHG